MSPVKGPGRAVGRRTQALSASAEDSSPEAGNAKARRVPSPETVRARTSPPSAERGSMSRVLRGENHAKAAHRIRTAAAGVQCSRVWRAMDRASFLLFWKSFLLL